MDSTTSVLVVHGRALVREGLNALFGRDGRVTVVGAYGTGRELLAAYDRGVRADVHLVDLGVPGWSGVDVVAALVDRDRSSRVLVMSDIDSVEAAVTCIRAGARGFVASSVSTAGLVRAVRSVAAGETVVDPSVLPAVLVALSSRGGNTSHGALSRREREVFHRLVAGVPVKRIAYELGLSPKTVSTYRRRLLEKLALRNNAELTAYALQHGLVAIGE